MTAASNPALFDTYNARFLDPRAIARSFILPHSIFGLLCKNENSLLIGPRGSGKTTLMKMLRPSALRAWQHEERSKILRNLSFTAVYIASDSGWTGRMSTVHNESNEYRIYEILQSATFVTYLMSSMLDAISESVAISESDGEELQRFRLLLNENLEGELSYELAKRWLLDLEFSSLRALRLALHDRIRAIDHLYFETATLKSKVKASQLTQLGEHQFLSLDLLSVMKSFVTTVNELCGEPERTWAFCIDEVEILNANYEAMLRSLRSTDQRLRFKISASPFSRTVFADSDSSAPMGGNDFTPITLTYARKLDGVRFGRQMLDALLAEAGLDKSPSDLFGKSQFEPTLPQQVRKRGNRYAKGGERHKALSELANTDGAFARYLAKRGIELDELSARTESERAEIRKLIQIAEIRREFGVTNVLHDRGRNILRHRSRKRIGDLYTGSEALITICDGNPRWLIGLFRPLIELTKSSGQVVSRPRQARSISTTIARYLSLLSTIPFPHERSRELPVTKSIDRIGEHFFNDITSKEFKTEPALSFVIDHKVEDDELEAIGAALNQGAFVFIPSQENEHCVGSIRNRRFRLSYMLCPRYKLPLMYGQPIVLSKILREHRQDDSQYTLVDLYR
jgi:hypothetical protein